MAIVHWCKKKNIYGEFTLSHLYLLNSGMVSHTNLWVFENNDLVRVLNKLINIYFICLHLFNVSLKMKDLTNIKFIFILSSFTIL